MLAYLAQLDQMVEELLPDHEGALSDKLGIAKQIIEDERLLSHKGIITRMPISSSVRPVSEVNAKRFKEARRVETVDLSCITLTSKSAKRVRCVKDVTSQGPRAKPTRFESSPNIPRNRSSSNLAMRSRNESSADRSLNAEMKRFHGMGTVKYRGLFRMRNKPTSPRSL